MEENFNTVVSETPQSNHTKPNFKKWVLGALIAFVVIGGAFRVGYVSGQKGYVFSPKNFSVTNTGGAPTEVNYGLLWEAIRIVQSKYINSGDIDPQQILYGAIRGAVSAAGDDYTEFFDPQAYSDFRTELQGSFSGIGAELGKKDGNIVIIAPLEDSPAQKAGIRAQDIILAINGETTLEMQADDAANKIRGPENTEVTLTIARDGESAPFDIKITRQKIEIKSVKYQYKDVQGKRVAIITISRFGDDTKDLFQAAVNDVVKNKPAAVIVDVRNNPGGYLETSVDLASQWLEKGKLVVKEEHSEKDATLYNSKGTNQLGGFKTIVLMNGGSASASEILAGALKDNGKATLVGEKSFGKGSVQELVALGRDMAVKVTIAKWITPGGKNLDHDGLEPDVKVELTNEDIDAGRDPQLDKALEEAVK